MNNKRIKVGVFDSGSGGLTIARELLTLTGLELVYYADTAHVPYGEKSPEQIKHLSHTIVTFFTQQEITLIVIACHTISSVAYEFLCAEFPTITFIGVVDTISNHAALVSPFGNIGILATSATINTHAHAQRIRAVRTDAYVIEEACPTLATILEDDAPQATIDATIVTHITHLLAHNVDTIVLGCTHYSLAIERIQTIAGSSIIIVSAEQTIVPLIQHFCAERSTMPSTIKLIATKNLDFFLKKAELLLTQG